MDRTQPRTVGILTFDDVEVLDFAGPFEVFSSARPIDYVGCIGVTRASRRALWGAPQHEGVLFMA